MSVDPHEDDPPLTHQADVYCEECGKVFTAYGDHTPATREEPAEFETDQTLCDECEEKQA